MLDLSVIILARNEELHIRRCLENILPVATEVFVIDCFSTDNTTAICRAYPRVKVIQHEWPGLYALQFNCCLLYTSDVYKRQPLNYIYVGRLAPEKNLELLIRELNSNGRPLTIVGDGPQKRCV